MTDWMYTNTQYIEDCWMQGYNVLKGNRPSNKTVQVIHACALPPQLPATTTVLGRYSCACCLFGAVLLSELAAASAQWHAGKFCSPMAAGRPSLPSVLHQAVSTATASTSSISRSLAF